MPVIVKVEITTNINQENKPMTVKRDNTKEITIQDIYTLLVDHIDEQKPLACLADEETMKTLKEIIEEKQDTLAFNRKMKKIGRFLGLIAATVTALSIIAGAAVLVLKAMLGFTK